MVDIKNDLVIHFLVMSPKWSSCKRMAVMEKFSSSVATLAACEEDHRQLMIDCSSKNIIIIRTHHMVASMKTYYHSYFPNILEFKLISHVK